MCYYYLKIKARENFYEKEIIMLINAGMPFRTCGLPKFNRG